MSKSNNIIASLSLGDTVTKLAAAADPKWWRVSTIIQGNHVERMTRTYTGGTAANWVEFLEQVDAWTPPDVGRIRLPIGENDGKHYQSFSAI